MSQPAQSAPRTAAALAARHRDSQAALDRVRETNARLRREKTPISVASVARRAGVSRTFLYTNADAKTAVNKVIRETADQRRKVLAEADDAREATWRERALNAEDALKAAHAEIGAQRCDLLCMQLCWLRVYGCAVCLSRVVHMSSMGWPGRSSG